jgi:hypothetical protein
MARRPPGTSPTAARGFAAYVEHLEFVLRENAAQVGIATADRRDAICMETGASHDAFEARCADFERKVRQRHPEAVRRAGCWAAEVLASYSSKVWAERLGLDLRAKRLAPASETAVAKFDRKARELAAKRGRRAA